MSIDLQLCNKLIRPLLPSTHVSRTRPRAKKGAEVVKQEGEIDTFPNSHPFRLLVFSSDLLLFRGKVEGRNGLNALSLPLLVGFSPFEGATGEAGGINHA